MHFGGIIFSKIKFSCNFNINKYNMSQELRSVLIAKPEVNKTDRKKTKVEADVKSFLGIGKKTEKKDWEKPMLEDVSGKVMAQPYIRFT